MKELPLRADGGVWRVAFAFDPRRNAILLVAGDKSGVSEARCLAPLGCRTVPKRGKLATTLSAKSAERTGHPAFSR